MVVQHRTIYTKTYLCQEFSGDFANVARATILISLYIPLPMMDIEHFPQPPGAYCVGGDASLIFAAAT
jgi:hypothetical protein